MGESDRKRLHGPFRAHLSSEFVGDDLGIDTATEIDAQFHVAEQAFRHRGTQMVCEHLFVIAGFTNGRTLWNSDPAGFRQRADANASKLLKR